MTTLSFPKTLAAFTKGCDAVLVVAPAATFQESNFPTLFDESSTELLLDLASDTSPGRLGGTSSTLTGGQPRRLHIGVLPDKVSRHNSESRAESIRKVVASSGIPKKGRVGILIILDEASHQTAAVNAVGRALPIYQNRKKKAPTRRINILCVDRDGLPLKSDKTAEETVLASRAAAEIVDTPPTELNPANLAKAARAQLKGIPNLKITEIKGTKLLEKGLRGIHAVGRCALSEPRMLIATYTPPKAKKGHIALVGKGITYDTGGLHIKGRGGMETMKADMGGSAAVLGAFRVLATTGIKKKITLVLCIAENAIGPDAYKPDDIIEMHSGLTVEINNTDAEGRIVLGDGVSYAARILKADTIIDAATLTGAQLIATGLLHAAVISNDEDLETIAVESGYRSGDMAHPLPFAPEFYMAEFLSPIADMRNSVKNRGNAQASCAAQFIYAHISDTSARWCHIDLAGPAFPTNRATGFGVALIAEMVRSL